MPSKMLSEKDLNQIAQTTSGGGLGHIPYKTGQV